MFAEHVLFKHEGMTKYMKRLQLVRVIIIVHISAILWELVSYSSAQHLKQGADFLKASTVDRVKKHLNAMDKDFKKELKYA